MFRPGTEILGTKDFETGQAVETGQAEYHCDYKNAPLYVYRDGRLYCVRDGRYFLLDITGQEDFETLRKVMSGGVLVDSMGSNAEANAETDAHAEADTKQDAGADAGMKTKGEGKPVRIYLKTPVVSSADPSVSTNPSDVNLSAKFNEEFYEQNREYLEELGREIELYGLMEVPDEYYYDPKGHPELFIDANMNWLSEAPCHTFPQVESDDE